MFVNGDLEGKFIMDRNLGARDTKFAPDGTGAVMFQFGRNVPFAGGSTYDGLTTAYHGRGANFDSDIITVEYIIGPISAAYAVNNPKIKISTITSGLNWCLGVDSETYVWNDYEQDYRDNGKSLFDPSPKGWKTPANGTWENFDTKMSDWSYDDETRGRSYPLIDDKFAYYPAQGYRLSHNSTLNSFKTTFFAWSSTPESVYRSYYLGSTVSNVNPSMANGRSYCLPIRPVQHDE